MKPRRSKKSGLAGTVVMLFFLLTLVPASLMFTAGCGGGGEDLTIDQVKLKASEIGEGWTLQEEIEVNTSNASPGSVVTEIYELGAVRIINQVFVKDGATLKVNLVEMMSSEDAAKAEELLRSAAGANTIGTRANMAVEIIGNATDKARAAELLKIQAGTSG